MNSASGNIVTKQQYKARIRRHLIVYCLLGPLFGFLIMDLATLAAYLHDVLGRIHLRETSVLDFLKQLSTIMLVDGSSVVSAYAIAIVPATIAGLIALKCKETCDECAIAALVAATPFLIGHLLSNTIFSLSQPLMIAAAALSGIACALTHGK